MIAIAWVTKRPSAGSKRTNAELGAPRPKTAELSSKQIENVTSTGIGLKSGKHDQNNRGLATPKGEWFLFSRDHLYMHDRGGVGGGGGG